MRNVLILTTALAALVTATTATGVGNGGEAERHSR